MEINTSLGKSKEEYESSLTSEEVTTEETTDVVTEEVKEEVTEEVKKPEAVKEDNVESQPPLAEETTLDEDLVRSKAKEFGYISPDDFEAQLEEKKSEWMESLTPQEESDFIKRAKELESQGYDINDPNYWSLVTKDYNKFDLNDVNQALDVILEGYKLEYPNASEEMLRQKLENDYSALYDDSIEAEDREYKRDFTNMSINAQTYLDKLKEKQSKAMPNISEQKQAILDAQLEERKIQSFLPKAEKEYKNKINKYFSDNPSYTVKVGDELLDYDLSKKEVGQLNNSLNEIFKRDYKSLIDENGSIQNRVKDDGVAVTVENLIWMNPELRSGILNKIIENNSAKRDKEMVKEQTNSTLPETQAKPRSSDEDVNKDSWSKVSLKIPS